MECDEILGLCVAQDEWESVLEVLDIMKRQGYTQTHRSYRACLQACLEAGNGASAREILQAMEKAGIPPDPYDIGLTVAALCRQDSVLWETTNTDDTTSDDAPTRPQPQPTWWRKAIMLLKSSASNAQIVTNSTNVIPLLAYNVVLECMVEEKQWKEAVRLLRLMEDSQSPQNQNRPVTGYHPAPDVSTYREVIECCVSTHQAEQAAQVLNSMKERGIKVRLVRDDMVSLPLCQEVSWNQSLYDAAYYVCM